jgi:drug/metabolite transporter (DMT)-like permease
VSLSEFGLLLISIVAGVTGQFFLKAGALKLGKVNAENIISHILGILLTPELIAGLLFYGMGAIFYILLLTRVNLSIVGPSVALSYVFSMLLGYFVFHEIIPAGRLVGLGFIVCGVILVVWQKR